MATRSYLFVPATSTSKIAKAYASAADAVIVDLEDSVAQAEKPAARRALAAIAATPRGSRDLWVRVNSTTTEHCYQDLVDVVQAGVPGVILPKVESAEEVRCIDWLLSQLERSKQLPNRSVALICIVESARGLVAANDIAAASPRIARLMFGAVDLSADMAIDMADAAGATDHARFALAVASRAAELDAPIDTAYVEVDNLGGLETTSRRARGLGYAAKVCIHPSQIAVVNSVFSPSEAELAYARRVAAAFAQAEGEGRAAVLVDGKMIDYPVAIRAQRLLDGAQ